MTFCSLYNKSDNNVMYAMMTPFIRDAARVVSFQFFLCRWSQPNRSTYTPARSHACSTLSSNFIVVHGGKCSSGTPCGTWMFNTITNEWTILETVKPQQHDLVPLQRWGHGCALVSDQKKSKLASKFYVFGGFSTETVSDDILS